MEYRNTLTAIGALAALAALSACSSGGSAVGPNNSGLQTQIANDVASSTGQAVASDIDETGNDAGDGVGTSAVMMTTRGFMMPQNASVSMGLGASNCTQTGAPSDLRYSCTPDTLTISMSAPSRADTLIRTWNYEFFAEDTAQSQPDSYTDSINFGGPNGVLVYAAIHRTRWEGRSHRIRNHSVTDHPSFAQDAKQQSTWNGNTLANDTASYTGTIWSVNYTGIAYDTTANVIYQRPRGQNPFPLSGQYHRWATWAYTANGPSTVTGTITRHIVVTFNGTDIAQLQVIGATTLTCDVNLVTGDVYNCQ
jgi:hypothetical protein